MKKITGEPSGRSIFQVLPFRPILDFPLVIYKLSVEDKRSLEGIAGCSTMKFTHFSVYQSLIFAENPNVQLQENIPSSVMSLAQTEKSSL